MREFFKMFAASCLGFAIGAGLLVLLVFFFVGAAVSSIGEDQAGEVAKGSVLSINLEQHFNEQSREAPFGKFSGESDAPGLYEVVQLIRHAKDDANIKGIYLHGNGSGNGYAASAELRDALLFFNRSKKFVIAHGDVMSQGAYYIAQTAEKVYINPVGALDWSGFSTELVFLKGALDRLKIQPQIFYAGKFKSATEPLRATEMTPENELQTGDWLGDLYAHFLQKTSERRGVDTATLRRLANAAAIETPVDAVAAKLIDGAKYDDEVKDEIKKRLNLGKTDKLPFVSIGDYAKATPLPGSTGSNRIAVIYAEGNIVDGEGTRDDIGGDKYVRIVRRARLDATVKAIVLRVNSGGGSALASEKIWRELSLAKKEKPVIVSFGDVAASGGYYIAAGADSIFAQPNTITGSIGVFGVIPNMQGFFNDKLGVTFDGIKTAEFAGAGSPTRPLTPREGQLIQASINRIYAQFLQRVAEGRKRDTAYINTIAQGRVWSGEDGIRIGLVDRVGSLGDAIAAAAKKAKLTDYRLRQYPEGGSWLDDILDTKKEAPAAALRKQLGDENYRIYKQILDLQAICGSAQARLPFHYTIR